MKAKFLCICPYGKEKLNKLVSGCMARLFLVSIVSIIGFCCWNAVWGWNSFSYLAEGIVLAVYIAGIEVPNYQLQEIENKVYRELLTYLSRVKHRYMSCHHMANAIFDAGDGMSYEIQRLAIELYRILVESNRKETVRKYILYHKTNKYLKLFLIQAYEVSEKGDLFFAENIEQLRLELMEELYRRRRRVHEFSGYVFVATTPFFFMPVLRQWGIEFAPELDFFYAGTGILLETVTFIVTMVIYGLIVQAKEIALFSEVSAKTQLDFTFLYKNSVISFLIRQLENSFLNFQKIVNRLIVQSGVRTECGKVFFQMFTLAVGAFLGMSVFFLGLHEREQKAVLEKVSSIETIAPVAGEEKRMVLTGYILQITKEFAGKRDVTEAEICTRLRENIRLGNDSMEDAVVQEILMKLEQYEASKGSLAEVFYCFCIGILAGMFPLLKLSYRKHTIAAGAVYEVRQFQSVILMERKLQGMTVIGLLEDMEVFSGCFRNCLRRCINSYGAGPEAALLRLKEEGSRIHESFSELADAFLSVDEVGIELAFAEVEGNRRLLEKMTQLEADIRMERKKDSTDLIAKIPMVLTVGAYFILPFFVHSLKGAYEVFELLEEMRM